MDPFTSGWEHHYVLHYHKSIRWLPGPEVIVQDHVCLSCSSPFGGHERCDLGWSIIDPKPEALSSKCGVRLRSSELSIQVILGRKTNLPDLDAHCTCPHPSHRDKP